MKNLLKKKVFIVLGILLFIVLGLWLEGVINSAMLYVASYSRDWRVYEDSKSGVYFTYPKFDSYFQVTTSGWTTIDHCAPDKFVLLGDKYQIYSLSICAEPNAMDIEALLTGNHYVQREVVLNGKRFTELATENEAKRNIVGRYYISADKNLLVGVSKGSFGDRDQSFYVVLTKLYLKIIGSIETNL